MFTPLHGLVLTNGAQSFKSPASCWHRVTSAVRVRPEWIRTIDNVVSITAIYGMTDPTETIIPRAGMQPPDVAKE
jgi:hypothetical protein